MPLEANIPKPGIVYADAHAGYRRLPVHDRHMLACLGALGRGRQVQRTGLQYKPVCADILVGQVGWESDIHRFAWFPQGKDEGRKVQVHRVYPYRVGVKRVYHDIPFFDCVDDIVVRKYHFSSFVCEKTGRALMPHPLA